MAKLGGWIIFKVPPYTAAEVGLADEGELAVVAGAGVVGVLGTDGDEAAGLGTADEEAGAGTGTLEAGACVGADEGDEQDMANNEVKITSIRLKWIILNRNVFRMVGTSVWLFLFCSESSNFHHLFLKRITWIMEFVIHLSRRQVPRDRDPLLIDRERPKSWSTVSQLYTAPNGECPDGWGRRIGRKHSRNHTSRLPVLVY